jgi:hypothetical protein
MDPLCIHIRIHNHPGTLHKTKNESVKEVEVDTLDKTEEKGDDR